MLHTRYNDRLKKHGIGVDAILEGQERRLFGIIRQHCSREFTLGITAASEHITAIKAACFVERPHIFNGADERMRALYVWHAMDE
uniref:metal-dependent hydrolase n=1 Tax=Acinetobacter baumannii TaxID=470 RepID=UPI00114728C6